MKGINSPGQALGPGGFASFAALRGGVFLLAFPTLARKWKHLNASAPLASFGNESKKNRLVPKEIYASVY
ncbi:MAG: hypothetical protein K9L75_00515 [Spirochaetia bacterium]|nr:hypothetical protein [Spirochaetia bacterium]